MGVNKYLCILVLGFLFGCSGKGDKTEEDFLYSKPDFAIKSASDLLGEYLDNINFYTKYIDVFGVKMVAQEGFPDEKLLISAKYMANILDNKKDLISDPDRREVVATMISRKTFVAHKIDKHKDMHPYDQGFLSSASTNASLFESEVWDGEREDSQKGGAQFEENFHIYQRQGLAEFLPEVFSPDDINSEISILYKNADTKRLYSYDDITCDNSCKAVEYWWFAESSFFDWHVNFSVDNREYKPKDKNELETMDPGYVKFHEKYKNLLLENLPTAEY